MCSPSALPRQPHVYSGECAEGQQRDVEVVGDHRTASHARGEHAVVAHRVHVTLLGMPRETLSIGTSDAT